VYDIREGGSLGSAILGSKSQAAKSRVATTTRPMHRHVNWHLFKTQVVKRGEKNT
jgi:hypothetical protein